MSTLPGRRDIIRLIGASAVVAFARRLGAAEDLDSPHRFLAFIPKMGQGAYR
jgi:hypothetical protein